MEKDRFDMNDSILNCFDIWTTAKIHKSSNGRGQSNGNGNGSNYGIKKLRELILDLAVRGKLVEQDPNDEPASELIQRVYKEKSRLIKVENLKTSANTNIDKNEKFVGDPKGWEYIRLGNLAKFIDYRGKTPQKIENGIPLITAKNVRFGYISEDPEEFISETDYYNWMTRGIPKINDLLFTTEAPLGNIALVDVKYRFALAQRVICFQLHLKEIAPFLRVVIMSSIFQKLLLGKATGMTATGIKAEKLKEIPVPIAPLAEQHRIVSKVNDLMSLCDQLEKQQTENNETHTILVETLLSALTQAAGQDEMEEAWQRIAGNFDTLFTTEQSIDKLKQTILQLAVMGKLVPQNPEDEPAGELLKRIEKEKERLVKEGKIKKQEKLAEIKEEEKPFELPKNWEWTRLENICSINPRNEAKDDLLVSFIPMALISTSHSGEHFQEENIWGNIKQGFTHFADGDIGLAKITPCFENSKAVFFNNLKNGIGAGTTELHIARPIGKIVSARYILFYLKSPQYLNIGTNRMTGTAGQKRVSRDFFALYPFPLPPLSEQYHIVSKVDELFSLCDALKERIREAEEVKLRLAEGSLF